MRVDEGGTTLAAAAATSGERQVIGGRYEVLGLLGSGGMGNVYKARDIELDEFVALKVLRPEIVSAPGALERFRREAKLARRVTHPNVARVFDIGEHGGERILTMEFVDGESLAACLRRDGRLSLARAVDIARSICAGVGAAHTAGVVHRDLKPDNVLLSNDGRVVVTDFGIARAAAEASQTVGLVGTPAYMAPEQINERSTIDQRADVYAFGAMLYEMLVGEPAWQAESLWALAAARLIEPPPDARAKRADLPPALGEITLRCMARDPGERYASMADVDVALASVELPAKSPTPMPVTDSEPMRAAMALAPTAVDKRVAVLPFANLGPNDQEYIADGLTEDLIDALSMARGLRVRSRGAVMQYKGSARDAREVGRDLNVQVIVEGSVRRAAVGFRINARVVSVSDGFQIWAKKFDVPETELLAQNDVIARAIADALTVDLAMPERAAAADARAVDLYLRARHAFHQSFTGDAATVLRLWDELLALTPDDPRALAGRAMAGAHQWMWNPALRKVAYDAADRAVALAPMLADGHVARGAVRCFDGDPVAAIAPLRRALRISPGDAEAHEALGRTLQEIDRDEGRAHLEAAVALEPAFEFPYINLVVHHELRGERERVGELFELARQRGVKIGPQVEGRIVLWRRDVERARTLRASLDPAIMQHRLVDQWCALLIDGSRPPPPPPAPPGMTLLPFLSWFFLQMEVEYSMVTGDIARAAGELARLDEAGCHHIAWLERCALLAPLRERPEYKPIRDRFAERAARVWAAYVAAER